MIYYSDNFLTLDFETTNHDHGSAFSPDNKVVLCSYAVGDGPIKTLVGDLWDPNVADTLDGLIANADFLVAHNAKFELQWLAAIADYDIPVFDTMLGEYVLLGNQRKPLTLEACCARRGRVAKHDPVAALIKAGVCPSALPLDSVQRYCEGDVLDTRWLMHQQRMELEESGRLPVLYTRCLVTPALAEMEGTGMMLDEGRVRDEYAAYSEQLREVNAVLHDFTGGINPKSGKQVGEFLYGTLGFDPPKDHRGNPILTPGGKPPVDKNSLAMLRPKTAKQKEFLVLKAQQAVLDAAITKTLAFFQGVVDQCGGLFYGRFNQAVTQTHRLSSSGVPLLLEGWDRPKSVQFQNFPRKFKRLFTARHKGWYVVEADGAQLEFRVAAFLGQDRRAIESIVAKEDIHSFTASVLSSAGQKTDRQTAKAHTFKPLYGGTSGTKAEQAYYKAFREKYPDLAKTQKEWTHRVLETKELVLPWGMTFYWPDTSMSHTGYITNTNSIYNYPIQSLATAEIIPVCVALLWKKMKENRMRGFLVNTVHDSVIAEIPPEEKELFCDLVVQVFTKDAYVYLQEVYGLDFNVPLGVEIKVGTHWGEAIETITQEATI